eukprot:TRINITY_DN7562_c0_g1_i1.p1 TRINITY_DN7562_c0_g1~~TRINITY_DN7562_c0_g1_i1.p1  ORF type:complete len:246 (+),score=35.04 TRINITY_DN7562_c0_g1_i1:163-900(+)
MGGTDSKPTRVETSPGEYQRTRSRVEIDGALVFKDIPRRGPNAHEGDPNELTSSGRRVIRRRGSIRVSKAKNNQSTFIYLLSGMALIIIFARLNGGLQGDFRATIAFVSVLWLGIIFALTFMLWQTDDYHSLSTEEFYRSLRYRQGFVETAMLCFQRLLYHLHQSPHVFKGVERDTFTLLFAVVALQVFKIQPELDLAARAIQLGDASPPDCSSSPPDRPKKLVYTMLELAKCACLFYLGMDLLR